MRLNRSDRLGPAPGHGSGGEAGTEVRTETEMNQKPEMFEGRIVRTVRSLLKDGDILQAIKVTRQWLIDTGRGDSFVRAKQIVEDVRRNERWVRSTNRRAK